MSRISIALLAITLASGCSSDKHETSCTIAADIAPASISPGYIADLTMRLAGGDRENAITEAVAQIHQKAPELDADEIADILIAADCANAARGQSEDPAVTKQRLATFRAQVVTLLGQQQLN